LLVLSSQLLLLHRFRNATTHPVIASEPLGERGNPSLEAKFSLEYLPCSFKPDLLSDGLLR